MQNKVEHVEDNGESQGLIKTPRQLIITIFLAFLIPVIGIILLVKLVTVTSPMGAGSQAQSAESIAQRIQPVAQFRLVDAAADASDESRTGEQVYDLTCATCHAAGVAGAPMLGDNAAWAPLIETGFDEMVRIAIEGVGAMPPRGGNPSLSDIEVARAVAHMANNSGGSFEEPTDDASGDAAESEPATDTDATAAAEPASDTAADTDAAAETQQAATDTAGGTQQAATAPDPAEVQQILTKNACLACHAVDSKLVGPSYRDVAEKYADDTNAAETIAQHIKQGSSGIWGPIPMPPNPGVSDDDLTKVVNWVLAGAPDAGSPAAGAADAPADAAQSDEAAAPEADAAQKTEATAEDATEATEPAAAADTDAAAETQQTAAPDPAEVQQILTKNAVENKLIGPSYRDVAGKYADDANAAETIAQHVKQGSSGIWGPIPMPPNPGISDEDLAKVVDWVLAGAPE